MDEIETAMMLNCIPHHFHISVKGAGERIGQRLGLFHVQIGHNVRIGRDTAISAQTGISGSTEIGEQVIMGGQVGVADHIRIADGVMIAAKSGVTGSIKSKMIVAGIPDQEIGAWRKSMVLIRNLGAFRDRLLKIEKKINALEEK